MTKKENDEKNELQNVESFESENDLISQKFVHEPSPPGIDIKQTEHVQDENSSDKNHFKCNRYLFQSIIQ